MSRLIASPRILNLLAAFFWYGGGLSLFIKGISHLDEAHLIHPDRDYWVWFAAGAALVIGGLQARYIFLKSCRRNIRRIADLKHPRLWQFFKPGFFVALAAMIALGVMLSRLAEGHYPWLIAVGGLDIAVGVSLLGSSWAFWREKAFIK